ncbi:MAG TPA: two-component regulator propeller domain-containing protein [Pyrinomonadaceae bacterium]|nr:two-component regulator propeller domain-containing protein [Pyrinomonadaceae bacterium]
MRVSLRQATKSLLFSLLFICSANAAIIKEKFLQTQWTTENGLPQNSISAMTQTPEGFLWLGTFGGLARFDGVRFKVFTTANTPEIKNNRISGLAVDNAGKLWIGTERGEIICYKDGKFKMIYDGKEDGNQNIADMFADEKGTVWIGVGRSIKNCADDQCSNINTDLKIGRIRKDIAGNLWVVANGVLYRKSGEKFEIEEKVGGLIHSIETNPNGGIWIVKDTEFGIYRNGIYETKGKFPEIVNYVGTFVKPDGTLYISYSVYIYEVKEASAANYDIYEVENAVGMTMRDIFVDREGIIWSERVGEGLIRLMEKRVRHILLDTVFPFTAANSLAQDAQGNIWLSSSFGLLRGTEEKFEKISKEPRNVISRGAMLFDGKGAVWMGTTRGLESYENGEFKLHQDISWNEAHSANSIFQDSRKNLWYGCENCGVFVSDGEKIIAKYSTENGLVGNVVHVIYESRDGSIWFGTRNGISQLKDGKFTNFTSENGLSNEYVRDIYEDADGAFWFGTYGGGLDRFKDGKFVSVTTKDGLFDDIVSRILIDDDDNFWMLGNRGIYSVNRKMLNDFADRKIDQVYCSAYTTADGMLTSEGNGGYQGAGLRAKDGKLWFPMIKGVVVIDPKQEKTPPPKPLIDEVVLNGKRVDISEKVEISPGNESLEVSYTGINFRKPDQIRFRYRLAGLDEKWTEAGLRRLANYPYLPSGKYKFQLTAANADGVWSNEIAEFEIVVNPPFWKTWWFLLLDPAVIFLIIVFVYKVRSRRFEKARVLQEEFARKLLDTQESERRRIASDIHDNLGQQLLVIKNWAGYCLSKIAEKDKLRKQIEQIDETAEQALDEVRALAKNLSPYHLDKAGLTNTVIYMVRQVAESGGIELELDFAKIDDFLPKSAEIYLYRIIQEAMNNAVKHSEAKNVKVTAEIKDDVLTIKIKDDGKGFYYYQTESENFGHGLSGMIKRAEMLQGNLTIKSNIGNGTLIRFELDKNDL